MIPDLLQISEVQYYIFQQTGVRVSRNQVNQWIKTGKIQSFRLRTMKKFTTKRAVDRFVKEHTREKVPGSENQGFSTLLEDYRKINNSKKPNSDSVVQ